MDSSRDIVIGSWTEAIDKLYIDSWQGDIHRFRADRAFMGLCDCNYELKTSLIRLGGPYDKLEFHLIRNFRKYARISDSHRYTLWNWLTLAQHHGLPTRLLDWTYSPFVAMHFATQDIRTFDRDGAIWCVDYVKIHKLLPPSFRKKLEEDGSHVFTVETLSDLTDSLQEFDSIARDEDFAVFFEPPSMDDRIINQYAFHSVICNPKSAMEPIISRHPDCFRRIIIPAKVKWEIRDKLDQANINERVLFPGLDGLCSWLTRHYSPSN